MLRLWKSKLLPLLRPTQRNVIVQILKLQSRRLTSFQDCLGDIRRKERARKDIPDIRLPFPT